MQGSSANDVVGAGQAVEEAGLQDKIAVVGTSLVSMSGKLVETGAVDLISFWDPALAGYAMDKLALMILNGETPVDGIDLGLPGYEKITLVNGKVFYGQAWIDVTKENLGDYDF
jgi:simple sugar transport system substrate-binding protein